MAYNNEHLFLIPVLWVGCGAALLQVVGLRFGWGISSSLPPSGAQVGGSAATWGMSHGHVSR